MSFDELKEPGIIGGAKGIFERRFGNKRASVSDKPSPPTAKANVELGAVSDNIFGRLGGTAGSQQQETPQASPPRGYRGRDSDVFGSTDD